jgi:hypothetical protein
MFSYTIMFDFDIGNLQLCNIFFHHSYSLSVFGVLCKSVIVCVAMCYYTWHNILGCSYPSNPKDRDLNFSLKLHRSFASAT